MAFLHHQLTRKHSRGPDRITLMPILKLLFVFLALFPILAQWLLHIPSVFFFHTALSINYYPRIALVDRLGFQLSHPVKRAWPTAKPAVGNGRLGSIFEEGALFHSFVNRGHLSALLTGSSLHSVWCGDPQAWPLEVSHRPSVVKMSSVIGVWDWNMTHDTTMQGDITHVASTSCTGSPTSPCRVGFPYQASILLIFKKFQTRILTWWGNPRRMKNNVD